MQYAREERSYGSVMGATQVVFGKLQDIAQDWKVRPSRQRVERRALKSTCACLFGKELRGKHSRFWKLRCLAFRVRIISAKKSTVYLRVVCFSSRICVLFHPHLGNCRFFCDPITHTAILHTHTHISNQLTHTHMYRYLICIVPCTPYSYTCPFNTHTHTHTHTHTQRTHTHIYTHTHTRAHTRTYVCRHS